MRITVCEQYYRNITNGSTFTRGREIPSRKGSPSQPIVPPVLIYRTYSRILTFETIGLRLADTVDAARTAATFQEFEQRVKTNKIERGDGEEQALNGRLDIWLRPLSANQADLVKMSPLEFYRLVHDGGTVAEALEALEVFLRRPQPLAIAPAALSDHLRNYPGLGANEAELRLWGMKYLEAVFFSETFQAVRNWGAAEFAWLATHPLTDFIRRPLVARWQWEKLKPQIPESLQEAVWGHFYGYAARLGEDLYFGRDPEAARRKIAAAAESEKQALSRACSALVAETGKLMPQIIERIGGNDNARTEVAHMMYGALVSLNNFVSVQQRLFESLRETLSQLKFWVIEDEAEWVEYFMKCADIGKHHPGLILKEIKDGQYELLIVNLLIPGTEGGIHFIRALREKADREHWTNFPKIVVFSSSTKTYNQELEALKTDGLISDYVNKAEFQPLDFKKRIVAIFPEKFPGVRFLS